ncbi:conserved hypothetical protein [Candidatus Sulfotelmatomonas gaucii]|uniref:ER-bound oxygenase mpaB/mpaB'/Rubber oxygenase catalytic domain-containing protein n=1 Tax=Candidatus Sulfuritelmatomonas gaucii TaxID=2043161 RepID=A0A2N9L4H8_9BACT|nr:conserved hypothetical protein [Candidatus Sulfotelmatomonas gaucii]
MSLVDLQQIAIPLPLPHDDDSGGRVSSRDSESLLAAIAAGTPDPKAGIFGPNSISWSLNCESALFLGAGRAALLQLAHPWVTASLAEHSAVMDDPIRRFHNTFRVVFTMVFGTLDQALAAARHLYTLHTRIRGAMPEDVARWKRGSHYEANQIAALRWVFATLVESAVLAHDCVLPPLAAAEREQYFQEWKTLAALFGLPAASLPEDWPAFEAYNNAMHDSDELGVSGKARAMAHNLLAGAGSWVRLPNWYCALTTEWMPERFRREFALQFGVPEQQAAARARRRLPAIYRRLPAAIRFTGPWREAQARLARRRVGALTRLSNRFWIGRPLLPFGNSL